MSLDYQDTFQRLIAKANLLAERYSTLADSKREADDTIEQLTQEIASLKKQNELLSQECEYLRMSAALVPKREQVEQTRGIIRDLVRDIDRCIADLTE